MGKEWETDFMDTTELFQQAMKVYLWEGCLRMIKCCGANEPVIVKNLIRYVLSPSGLGVLLSQLFRKWVCDIVCYMCLFGMK